MTNEIVHKEANFPNFLKTLHGEPNAIIFMYRKLRALEGYWKGRTEQEKTEKSRYTPLNRHIQEIFISMSEPRWIFEVFWYDWMLPIFRPSFIIFSIDFLRFGLQIGYCTFRKDYEMNLMPSTSKTCFFIRPCKNAKESDHLLRLFTQREKM